MAKTIKEMVEVMDWFDKGGEVESAERKYGDWDIVKNPIWDWYTFDYRIKKPKQKVTIEKWLVDARLDSLIEGESIIKVVVETSDIDAWLRSFPTAQKIKLIESYEVEI